MLRRISQILFFALLIRPFMLLFIGLRVRGRANLPQADPFLLIANHASHLDTAALLSLFPLARLGLIQPVAAADYFERNRFISGFSKRFFNILPIARTKITVENHPVRQMQQTLEAGHSLILFPEGTRGSGDEPAAFRAGVAHLIERAPQVPVVPVWLQNMGRSLPKGAFIPVPFFCEVRIGKPRLVHGKRAEIVHQLEEAVRELREPA